MLIWTARVPKKTKAVLAVLLLGVLLAAAVLLAGRGHGGEMITSVALHVCGGQVRMDRAACEQPLPGLQAVNRWKGTPFAAFGSFAGYCRGGAWGDTSHASAEQGALLMERGVEAVCAFLNEAFGG